LRGIIATVARHYLTRAMEVSHGNKTRAAELVGLPNYQTLTNWLLKYGVG
jgi:DNA-binding protein Fis